MAAYRDWMVAEWLIIIVFLLVVATATRFALGALLPRSRAVQWPAAARWPRTRAQKETLPRRPIEQLARDLRRLGPKFHQPPAGTSRVKREAARYAYDRALGEAATAVGVEHLLAVLAPGDDLDAERRRVEDCLWLAGVRTGEAA